MKLPAIAPDSAFEYCVRVQPHHTDYAGIVWHGTYVAWLEEARVEYLRSHGIEFADWVNSGVDLPVVDLSLQYRRSLTMGETAVLKSWALPPTGVKLVWQYAIYSQDTAELCVTAQVTLVPVSHEPPPQGAAPSAGTDAIGFGAFVCLIHLKDVWGASSASS